MAEPGKHAVLTLQFTQGCDELEQAIAELAEWADDEAAGTTNSSSKQRILSMRDRLSVSLAKFTSSMNDGPPVSTGPSSKVNFDNPLDAQDHTLEADTARGDLSPSAGGGSLFVSEAGKLQRLKSIQMMEEAMKDKVSLNPRLINNTVMFLGGPGLQSQTTAILWAAGAFVGGMSGVYTLAEYLREFDQARPPVDVDGSPIPGMPVVGDGNQLEAAADILVASGTVLVGLVSYCMYTLWTLLVDISKPSADDVFSKQVIAIPFRCAPLFETRNSHNRIVLVAQVRQREGHCPKRADWVDVHRSRA